MMSMGVASAALAAALAGVASGPAGYAWAAVVLPPRDWAVRGALVAPAEEPEDLAAQPRFARVA